MCNNHNETWINELYQWADANTIPDLQYIHDDTVDDHGELIFEGFCVGLPRNRKVLLSLKELDLSWHNCTEIPEQIRYLTQLKVLRFAKSHTGLQPPFHENADGVSKISFIPEWISELKDLEVLDLSGNQIQHISEAVSKLHKLKKLYLDDNGTVVIDPSLSKLTALEVLWLQKSRLSNLKKIVYQLPNLKEFYLSQLDECKYGPIMSNPRGIEFVGEDELTLLQIRPQTSEKCESFTHSLGCMLTMLKVW